MTMTYDDVGRAGALSRWRAEIASTLLLLSSASAMAGSASASGLEIIETSEPPPETVAQFVERVGEIAHTLKVGDNHLAFVVKTNPNDQGVVIFSDKDAEVMFSGIAIDAASGENLSHVIIEAYGGDPGPTEAERALETAAETHFLTTNKGRGSPIYLLVDFQCSYCHQLAKEIELRDIPREIRWIPVGFLGQRSMLQAAALLGLPEDRQTPVLMELATGRSAASPPRVTERLASKVRDNERWAESMGLSGTPALLLEFDGEARRVIGLPQPAFWDIIEK